MIHINSQPHGAEIPYTHEKRGHEDTFEDDLFDLEGS